MLDTPPQYNMYIVYVAQSLPVNTSGELIAYLNLEEINYSVNS